MRAMSKKKHNKSDNTIARNRRARFDYHLEDTFEAGIELRGWEVKSLRMGKADISDSYVMIKSGEAFLLGTWSKRKLPWPAVSRTTTNARPTKTVTGSAPSKK